MLVRFPHFHVRLVAKRLNAVPSVQSHSDLLVRVHESFQLCIKLDVLTGQHVAMVLKSIDFRAAVNILSLHGLRCKTELVLFVPVTVQVILSATTLGLQVVQIRGEVSVASKFTL